MEELSTDYLVNIESRARARFIDLVLIAILFAVACSPLGCAVAVGYALAKWMA